MKTIKELESKKGYRRLKVIYIILILIVLFIVFLSIKSAHRVKIDNDKSYIQCVDGTSYSLSSNNVKLNSSYIGYYDDERFVSWCGGNGYELISLYTKNNWLDIILRTLFSVSIGLFVTEIFKRIHFYIILGSFFPKKK